MSCPLGRVGAEGPDGAKNVLGQFRELLLLLRWKNRVFHAFAYAELERGLGRNLYGLAGLRVAALARLALGEHHLAEAWEDELAVLLDLAGGKIGQLLEQFLDLRPLQLELFGEVVDHFRL